MQQRWSMLLTEVCVHVFTGKYLAVFEDLGTIVLQQFDHFCMPPNHCVLHGRALKAIHCIDAGLFGKQPFRDCIRALAGCQVPVGGAHATTKQHTPNQKHTVGFVCHSRRMTHQTPVAGDVRGQELRRVLFHTYIKVPQADDAL